MSRSSHPTLSGSRPQGRREPAGSAPAPRGPATDPRLRLARGFAVLYCEVESGRRPRSLLAPLLTPSLAARLGSVWIRPGTPAVVLRVSGWGPAAGRFDAVAILRRGERTGALALRLVRRSGRWLVHEAVRPEDGPLPEPEHPFPDEEELDSFDLTAPPDPGLARPALYR